MPSDFKEALDDTLKNEGVLSNDKYDPGGITKNGISLRFLEENGIDVNHDGSINGKDIYDLSLDDITTIYKLVFWQKTKIFMIDNQQLANKVFDLSVNMGSIQAIKLLQRALILDAPAQLVMDGLIGPATLKAIVKCKIDSLLKHYRLFARDYYKNLVVKNPHLSKFLNGWLKRASK